MAEISDSAQPPQVSAGSDDNFTVVVKRLPKHISAKQVKQFVQQKHSVKCRKIVHSGICAFVICSDQSEMLEAIAKLDGATIKGVKLRAKQASADPSDAKRPRLREVGQSTEETKPPTECDMLNVVTPLRNLSYADQLSSKHSTCLNTSDDLRAKMTECGVPKDRCNFGVDDVIPSPVTVGYRNKCEFAIGRDPSDKLTVGFVCGRRPNKGAAYIFPIKNCCHVADPVKNLVAVFENKLLNSSKMQIYDEKEKTGVWKMLTVRFFPGDMMAIVTVGVRHQSKLASEITPAIKEELLALTENATDLSMGYYLTSLFLSFQVDISDEPVYERVWGAPYIYESLMNVQFRISPAAFFQTNSAAAEKLYATIIDKAKLADDDIVLDLCCGTGTIALCIAAHAKVRCVIGVELCQPAVIDARQNFSDNNQVLKKYKTPCKFACGRAEDVFKDVKYLAPKNADGKDINVEDESVRMVAIVDPPRAGLHAKLVHSLRSAKAVHRLIYVSCEPKLAMNNFVNLSRPVSNRYFGDCFVLKSVSPVDMFPMTELCEWVMVFERE